MHPQTVGRKDAADPNRFPEQIAEGLRPWKAKKLYIRSGGFQQPRTEPSKEKGVVSINAGEYDPLLGRSSCIPVYSPDSVAERALIMT